MKGLGDLTGRIPITIKIPVVVAVLMVAVGAIASERVLSRLVATQERQIRDITNAYLDGLASPLIEPVLRRDPWEIFDVLDQARQLDAAVRPVETVVTEAGGAVLAGSNPRHAVLGASLPTEFPVSLDHSSKVLVREADSRAFVDRRLVVEGRTIGTLHAEFDISALLAERREVILTLLSTNTALTLVFAALGWFTVRRMVRPMKVLADHLEAAQGADVKPIPEELMPSAESEAGRLFRRFNRMADAIAENAALASRLSDEERLASLGRLASGMAHEINNPLGGLFNALDTLRKHGDKPVVRASALPLIERGLTGIKEVVRAALTTYRRSEPARPLAARDFDDVKVLLGPELRRRHQTIEWDVPADLSSDLPATLFRQALLNLMLNASAAAGEGGAVGFAAAIDKQGVLGLDVRDSGPGMPENAAAILTGERTYAMLRDGRGLGLWMVRRLVDELGGKIEVMRSGLGGAEVRLRFPPCEPAMVTANVA
jgi:signal transduction histidine kinase